MIKLQVIGNLGRDAIVNNVNGKSVINFSLAHTEKYKDAQGVQQDRTTWVECAYWTDRTAVAPYLRKGTTVYTEGTPNVESYVSKDGKNGVTLRLRVNMVQLVGSNNNNQEQRPNTPDSGNTNNNMQQAYTPPSINEDTPF